MSDEDSTLWTSTPQGEQADVVIYALLAGTARGLDLHKRLPELMRSRGFPTDDVDLVSVLKAAVALKAIGAGATLVHRPSGADALRGAWPADSGTRTASQIVEELELQRLLEGAVEDPR